MSSTNKLLNTITEAITKFGNGLKNVFYTKKEIDEKLKNTGSANIDDDGPKTDKVYSSYKTEKIFEGALDKETYASEKNEGSVKYADNLSGVKHIQPLQYWGSDSNNEVGLHYFPINTKDNTGLQQRVTLDAKANDIINIDSTLDISDNKVMVECYKFIQGEQDIVTVKTFNNTEKDNFFYDKDNVEFTDSMHIKKEYTIENTLNSDSFYESETINKDDYLEFMGMEAKKI